MELLNKLKSLKVDYLIIIIKTWDINHLELIKLKIKKFNSKFYTINNLIIIMKTDFDMKETKIFLWELIKLEIYIFNAFLIYFNKYSNILKTKITNFFYKNKLESKIYYFDYFKDFLQSHILINKVINKRKINLLSSNKKEDYNKVVIWINNFMEIKKNFKILLNLLCIFGKLNKISYDFKNVKLYISYKKKKSLKRLFKNKHILIYNNIKIDMKLIKLISIKNNLFIKPINFQKKEFNIYNNINIKMKYNHPSNKVMIYNINSNIKSFEFYKLIKNIQKPWIIKFIDKEYKITKICIVLFNTIKEAFNFILKINNKKYFNYKIKCIFSYYKFDI